MAAVDERAADLDEEDTLTEADRVPAVDTMVVSLDEIAAAYDQSDAPKPKERRRLGRVLALVIVLLALAAIALALVWGLMR